MTGDRPAAPPRSRLRTLDRVVLWGALGAVVVLAWWYLALAASAMGTAEPGDAGLAGLHPWSASDYLTMFAMWAIMMVAMMLPTAMRAITIYARIAGMAREGNPVAATGWFVLGYVLVWSIFSLLATALQSGLASLGLLSSAMVASSSELGAALLLAAGVYQLTPYKDVCLRHCQSPVDYLSGRFGPRHIDGISLGMRHGGYCLGCCWLIMLLLFVGGVMNLLWIALITAFVIVEKLVPGRRLSAATAGVMILGGGYVLMSAP